MSKPKKKKPAVDTAKPLKAVSPIPDTLVSWNLAHWPEWVFPHNAQAGRHLCREHRKSLADAGALVRVNREIVVLGIAYMNWLRKHSAKVLDFELPCNAPEHAAKRNNGVGVQS